MYKFVNFCNLKKKTGESHGNVKNDRHTIDISKFPRKMNELSY